jgi:hypothetical protein
MSKEFEKLEALLDLSGPSERDPQVDRDEAAKLAARWGWLARRARGRQEAQSRLPRGATPWAIRATACAPGSRRARLGRVSRRSRSGSRPATPRTPRCLATSGTVSSSSGTPPGFFSRGLHHTVRGTAGNIQDIVILTAFSSSGHRDCPRFGPQQFAGS